jgi:SAM-dependent methyltransferase
VEKFKESIQQRLTARHLKCFRFAGDIKGKKILDIGSSFGWFEQMALKAGCKEVVGIEPEEKLFYEAQKEVPRAIFKKGSALKIPAKDKTFDLVVMFDVLEHLPKNKEIVALKEIKRVLKDGGKLVLSTPLNYWLANLMDPAWYFGHRHYNKKKLKEIIEKPGFRVQKTEIRGGFFEMMSIILLYVFKWIFRKEVPFKDFLERKRNEEYLSEKDGFMTIFVRATY